MTASLLCPSLTGIEERPALDLGANKRAVFISEAPLQWAYQSSETKQEWSTGQFASVSDREAGKTQSGQPSVHAGIPSSHRLDENHCSWFKA
jgi:hypothetical protein